MTSAVRLLRTLTGSLVETLVTALERLVELPRNIKQAFLLLQDMAFIALALWSAIALRLGVVDFPIGPREYACAAATAVISAAIFLRLGLYRAVVRFMGHQATWTMIRGVSYSTMVLTAMIFLSQVQVPRSLPFLYWAISLLLIGGTRLLVRAHYQRKIRSACEKVIIYGAGESGRQLLTAVSHGNEFHVLFFVDDDPRLQRSVINGVQVIKPGKLESLIHEHDISQVLLALPSVDVERRRDIIKSLESLPVYVRTVPKLDDLLLGKARVGQVQDIELEVLLERDPVTSHPGSMRRYITHKVVMVTGAGGSIGAELCRQILLSNPSALVLLDISELALYNIERELRRIVRNSGLETELIAKLGSVQNRRLLKSVYETFAVQTVYHAAAYKHVPMVEYNVVEGVANNVLGTMNTAEEAVQAQVETFVLVSTDKAVRPTNIMGASKRFAEIICQGLAARQAHTRFCMVRFGNVLGSSGSVVPLFREQIHAGGPLTVTHPEVSRYFMTIPEAASLVLQASAISQGGDVLVLDMGKPVKIAELAERMIRLSGYTVKDRNHPDGELEIKFIGLRPGEKLHEELLMEGHERGTAHPMVMRAKEECPPLDEIDLWLKDLQKHCEEMDCDGIKTLLLQAVSGFEEHEGMHDQLWNRQREQSAETSSNVQALFPSAS